MCDVICSSAITSHCLLFFLSVNMCECHAGSKVATCEYTEGLQETLMDVQQQIDALQHKTDNDTSALEQRVGQLQTDVGVLQGGACLPLCFSNAV